MHNKIVQLVPSYPQARQMTGGLGGGLGGRGKGKGGGPGGLFGIGRANVATLDKTAKDKVRHGRCLAC